jgi:hypothetical protein
MKRIGRIFSCAIAILSANANWAANESALQATASASSKKLVIPKLWDDQLLATWALPVAGLNITPHFIPESEYYAAPIDNLRTYPVYNPDFEPKGYQ